MKASLIQPVSQFRKRPLPGGIQLKEFLDRFGFIGNGVDGPFFIVRIILGRTTISERDTAIREAVESTFFQPFGRVLGKAIREVLLFSGGRSTLIRIAFKARLT